MSSTLLDLKHPCSKNWLIHLHYVRREFETCKSVIHEELARLNGNSEYANYILALVLRSEGRMQESLDRLQVCHELEPMNANTVNQIARSLFLLGRHRLAVDAYQKAQLLSDDSDSETHYNMGMCYLFMKDLDKAKEHMSLSLQARVSYDAFEILAQISLAKDNIPEAISVYEKALKTFPENPALLSSVGILYMKVGKDQLSFMKLGSALAYDPTSPKALVAIASMIQTYEDYDFALAKYKIAMQKIPDSSSLWNNIGMCFFGKRKFVAAISCLKRACYLSPFDWKILHNLGLVHLHMQQYASAFHFLTAAINLKPDQSQNFVLLAVAISHLESAEQVRLSYEQALRLNATASGTIHPFLLYINYAISMFNHKFKDEAIEKLQAAEKLALEGDTVFDDEIRDILHRLKSALKINDEKTKLEDTDIRNTREKEDAQVQRKRFARSGQESLDLDQAQLQDSTEDLV
ncbi:unnamed protein product [Allacma fusca]|uniref:Bardet-Biedl syndrome 4 n=1 Tax=Allacma fusca TaxID=39272 RepID=A0A8J2L8T8_9HEXA|nr:unnamed protein product [Allacma fusca]